MPEIRIQSISTCSSEDSKNPAENLLKEGGSYKWRSASAGEKSVSVILKLEKATQIHSIDIGNEGSAFVEVLVGKESDTNFEVMLVASSFMTPLESRNGTNKNGVRMFGQDKLSKTTSTQKWDRVKIVCTQPFCKTSAYGLSFIKFHSPPDEKTPQGKTQQKLGRFTIRDEDNEDDIPTGSLFANRSKVEQNSTPIPAGAASIRAASKQAEQSPGPSTFNDNKDVTRKRLADSPPKTTPSPKAARAKSPSPEAPPKPTMKRQTSSLSSTASSASSVKPEKSALKTTKSMPSAQSEAKAFSKLMENVTFVMSGFQNPFRGELRDKACEMGAKYKPDWARGCTHLICAFANTPKYKQVSGKGKIVTKSWVLDCHKQKRLLPWRKYRLGDADSPSEDSDDEEVTSSKTPRQQQQMTDRKPDKEQQKADKIPKKTPKPSVAFEDSEDSGGDTEDELLKVKALAEKKKVEAESTKSKADDPYGDSTDEDEDGGSSAAQNKNQTEAGGGGDDGSDSGLPDLPDFFTDKHFFFYGDFQAAEQRLLTRYIAAYNGEVEDYMSKRVKYVITLQQWDDNFEEALSENPDLVFVKPKWIFNCHEKVKLVPYQPYIVVPK